jgi:hypothetical protein
MQFFPLITHHSSLIPHYSIFALTIIECHNIVTA